MPAISTAATTAGLLLFILVKPVAAQIDYHNLDEDRPVITEDAYPVERYAFEALIGYRLEDETGRGQIHTAVPEVAYGLVRNAQLGIKLGLAGVDEGRTDWGLAGLQLFGLYNFNTEGGWLPALSLRADATFPVGSLAGEGTRVAIKGIATRSWGKMRVHANVAGGFGSEDALPATDAISRWSGSLAVDRTFFRSSLVLIAEIAASQDIRGAPTPVNASVGGRWQWRPTLVLDAGITRRLRSDIGPDIAVTIGLSHAFAIRGLMPADSR